MTEQVQNQPEKKQVFDEIPSAAEMHQQAQNARDSQNNTGPKDERDDTDAGGESSSFDMPDKFKGKTMEEVAESYSHLETRLGQQAQEVGTLRQLNDRLLDLSKTTDDNLQQPVAPDLTVDDVLNDPGKAITDIATDISKGEVAQTNSRVDQLEAQLALGEFEGRHPTFREDQNDPKFQEFVKASGYRQGLAIKVASGDLGAGEELWNAWEENKTSNKEPTPEEKDAAETAAALATRGGAEGGQTRKPISREKLAQIRIHEEERYYSEEFQTYVQYMYKHGLVK